jgi:hypothetical protein|tara:strand:- start:81 stop:227 length:147 start_codon:yes stop_codon:yes gene_type:complete
MIITGIGTNFMPIPPIPPEAARKAVFIVLFFNWLLYIVNINKNKKGRI